MALDNTQIADLIGAMGERELGQLTLRYVEENNSLLTSGLCVTDESVALLASGPDKGTINYINPLATDKVNVGTDDMSQEGDIIGLTSGVQNALRLPLNMGVGAPDLIKLVTGFSHEPLIQEAFGLYQLGIDKKVIINAIKGAVAKAGAAIRYQAVANDSALKSVILASAGFGAAQESADILMLNSANFAKMRVDTINPFIPANKTEHRFAEWAGYKLIQTEAFGNDMILCKSGAVAYGHVNPHNGVVPFEVERRANSANGQGGTVYHTRWALVAHPQGFDYTGDPRPQNIIGPVAAAGGVPANALLATGANSNWALTAAAAADITRVPFRVIVPAA